MESAGLCRKWGTGEWEWHKAKYDNPGSFQNMFRCGNLEAFMDQFRHSKRVSATLGFSSRTSIEQTEVQWKTLGVTKNSRATEILGYQTDHLCLTSNSLCIYNFSRTGLDDCAWGAMYTCTETITLLYHLFCIFLLRAKVCSCRTKRCALLIGTNWYSVFYSFSQLFAFHAHKTTSQLYPH